jgi:hypothetical protein
MVPSLPGMAWWFLAVSIRMQNMSWATCMSIPLRKSGPKMLFFPLEGN